MYRDDSSFELKNELKVAATNNMTATDKKLNYQSNPIEELPNKSISFALDSKINLSVEDVNNRMQRASTSTGIPVVDKTYTIDINNTQGKVLQSSYRYLKEADKKMLDRINKNKSNEVKVNNEKDEKNGEDKKNKENKVDENSACKIKAHSRNNSGEDLFFDIDGAFNKKEELKINKITLKNKQK